MQNHFNLHKALHFLVCSIIISCQNGKQHAKITDVSNELLCKIIGHLYDEEDMQSSRFVNRRFKNVTEDVVRSQYKTAHKPYEINGSSQALFRKGLSYVKKFGIQHVRYRGPMDRYRIRSLIRLADLLNRDDRPLLSLHLLNQNRDPVNKLDLDSLNIGDALNSFLSILSDDTKNNLRELNLRGNQLTAIPGLENLTQLQKLDISNNQLTDITGLEKLTQLENLYLSYNQLTDITELENLTKLKELLIHENQLTDITGLEKLTQLRLLLLFSNQLTDITGLKNLTQLENLYLSYNQLTDITGLEKLTQLQKLDIGHNRLTDITGLEKLTQLEDLNLNHNQLTDITGLEKLTQLRRLDLSHNQLTDITGLEKLTQLKDLDLSHNQLTDITGLEKLTQLIWLYLTGNLININNKEIAELRNRGVNVSY
ncbi:leucine-rich repeat domain-containing protein [Candidatus Cardinium hertigii]|uniref:Internalin-A n=1 Tax=Candidatus Cardinium hertigii TaxID=247481 RepID=A0A3N2QAS2_9BACT|nr:leucine-rich repeat domain-containing protein [Candidatus Cardinium hertigii]ROT46886.1 hypothetical protein EDM02_04865 [Candidatus Cardinium hertigii]